MKIKKRPITAATSIDDMFNGAFSELWSSADKVDYKLEISEDMKMTLTAKGSDAKYLPEITVTTNEDPDDGIYYFTPKLEFPDLDQEDMDYYDSIHYYLGKWENIGKFITELVKFEYSPANYEED